MAARVSNADDGDVYSVGALEVRIAVILGMLDVSPPVWLHAHTIAHIVTQRSAPHGDAEFVLQYLPATIQRPDAVGIEARDSRRFRLVKYIPAERRHLHVSLKTVTVPDIDGRVGELWVSSAFPLGRRSLTRLRRRERLHAVDWEAER